MSEHTVVMAVATYRSRADADRDFAGLSASLCRPDLGHAAAAQVCKGDDGQLVIDRHAGSDPDKAGCPALLGAALTVIAAPLGIQLLAPLMATRAAWAGIAALVAVFWHHIPKDRLHKMSDLLEAHQSALVVVALDRAGDEIRTVFPDTAITTLVATTSASFDPTPPGLEDGDRLTGQPP